MFLAYKHHGGVNVFPYSQSLLNTKSVRRTNDGAYLVKIRLKNFKGQFHSSFNLLEVILRYPHRLEDDGFPGDYLLKEREGSCSERAEGLRSK